MLLELARDRSLCRAVASYGFYRLAEYGPWLAILVYAYGHGGATATGLVSFGILIPTGLFAPLAGPLIDRFGASKVLLGAYAVQALVMAATSVALLAGSPPALVYVLAALTAMALTVAHPAYAVVSPGLAHTTEQLVALNAVTGWVLSIGLVLGPALAGAILAFSTPGVVYLAGALALTISTLLVLPLHGLVPPLSTKAAQGVASTLRGLAQGGRALVQASASWEVVIVIAAAFATVGALDVLLVRLAIGPLDMGGSGAGYLSAAHGGGAVAGAAVSLALVGRPHLVPVLIGAGVFGGAALVVLGLITTVVVAFLAAAVTGLSRSLLEVTGQTLMQRVTSTELLAGAFAFKEGLAMSAWGIGAATVPAILALTGTTGALIFTGAIVPAVMLVRLRRLLAVDAAVTVPAVTIALLRSLVVFRALPVPALEGVAKESTEQAVSAGTVVIREGERGDSYYAVADGVLEVTQDGRKVNELSRGDGCGEIALLHDAVRTATVTAVTDARLVAVEREPFLIAVTGHGETLSRFQEVAQERLEGDAEGCPAGEWRRRGR
jgi:MFS family permease